MNPLNIIAALCIAFSAQAPEQQRGWRGIVPLRSTRSAVEQLLGARSRPGRTSVHRTETELVRVEYVISPCKGSLPGWNVPADTVLQVKVISANKVPFSELKVTENKYIKTPGRSGWTSYTNLEDGIKYEVLPDGIVYSVTYLPSVKDSTLRCPGYPAFNGEVTGYELYAAYGELHFAAEEGRLDNFAFALQSDPAMKGYVIVYAGQYAPVGEARIRAERARNYLINKRGIDKRRVDAFDGGHRSETETELYLIPRDMPAPALTPTVSRRDVKIGKEGRAKSNRRSPHSRRKQH